MMGKARGHHMTQISALLEPVWLNGALCVNRCKLMFDENLIRSIAEGFPPSRMYIWYITGTAG